MMFRLSLNICLIMHIDLINNIRIYRKWLILSGSPVTRWASIAFGAGVGIGSAYSECSQKIDAADSKVGFSLLT